MRRHKPEMVHCCPCCSWTNIRAFSSINEKNIMAAVVPVLHVETHIAYTLARLQKTRMLLWGLERKLQYFEIPFGSVKKQRLRPTTRKFYPRGCICFCVCTQTCTLVLNYLVEGQSQWLQTGIFKYLLIIGWVSKLPLPVSRSAITVRRADNCAKEGGRNWGTQNWQEKKNPNPQSLLWLSNCIHAKFTLTVCIGMCICVCMLVCMCVYMETRG